MEKTYLYIRNQLKSKIAADRFIHKIKKETEDLSYCARSYYLIHQTKNDQKEKRRLVVNNFIIIYEINLVSQEVYLLHLFYYRKNNLYSK